MSETNSGEPISQKWEEIPKETNPVERENFYTACLSISEDPDFSITHFSDFAEFVTYLQGGRQTQTDRPVPVVKQEPSTIDPDSTFYVTNMEHITLARSNPVTDPETAFEIVFQRVVPESGKGELVIEVNGDNYSELVTINHTNNETRISHAQTDHRLDPATHRNTTYVTNARFNPNPSLDQLQGFLGKVIKFVPEKVFPTQ